MKLIQQCLSLWIRVNSRYAHLPMTREQSDMSCSSAMIPLTGDTLQERKGKVKQTLFPFLHVG